MVNLINSLSLNNRGGRLKINIISGFLLKGCSMALSLVFIPLVLSYLTSYKYGIWMTINSVISWFSMMDVGLAGGLRFKLQETLSKKDWDTSRKYISTTYNLLSIISTICILVFVSFILFLDLNYASFFKVPSDYNNEIEQIIIVTIICFFLRFILQPISVILAADQLDFVQSIILLMENVWNLIGILFLICFTRPSLLYAAMLFSITPLFNLLIFNIIFFCGRYRRIRPQIGCIFRESIKPLIGFGVDVFIISVSMILVVQCNNILITMFFTPNEVTVYNIVVKLFATISSFYILLISPMWSAFGNAFANNDFVWVRQVFYKMLRTIIYIAVLYLVLVVFSPYILRIWSGLDIHDYTLIICCGVYFILQNLESTYSYLFNGSGKKRYIRLQRNLLIFGALVNIPSIFLMCGVLKWGLYSIFIASLLALLPRVVIYVLEGRFLLKFNDNMI